MTNKPYIYKGIGFFPIQYWYLALPGRLLHVKCSSWEDAIDWLCDWYRGSVPC